MVHFGLQITSYTYPGVPTEQLFGRVAEIATTAEEAGFDSLWVMDHFLQIPGVGQQAEPMLEGHTLLAALAVTTQRVELGTLVAGVVYRNPALLAKVVTTIDAISGGRAILGIGAGWFEHESMTYGFPFPPLSERMERLEDAVRICQALFAEEAPTVAGLHHYVVDAPNSPRPVRPGGPPILIGGGGERRTLRLVAQYADYCNLFGDPATLRHKLAVLDRHCEEVGRDPAEIVRTRLGTTIIAPTAAEADRLVRDEAARLGIAEDELRGRAVVGDPDAVGEQLQAMMDAGLDGMMVNLPNAHELEPIALVADVLRRLRRTARVV